MQNKFGINLFGEDPLTSLEMLKTYGYAYVDYGSHFNFHSMHIDRLRKMKEKTLEFGLRPFSLHNPYCLLPAPEEKDYERKIRQLREVVDVAAFLDVDILTVHPGVPDRVDTDIDELIHYWNTTGFDEINRKSIEQLAELCRYADQSGIVVTIENLPVFKGKTASSNFYSTVDELLNIIRSLALQNITNIGICFDTGHANLGGIDISDGIMKAGPYLKQLHLNDNMGDIQGDMHLICGEGNIQWDKVINSLDNIAFAGPVTFEHGSRSGHCIEYMMENCIENWKRLYSC
jgi:sugar phosphate isomerase/epimerase